MIDVKAGRMHAAAGGAVMLLMLAALVVTATDADGSGYAVRLSGALSGFPFQTAEAQIEAAVAWTHITLYASAEMPYLPYAAWDAMGRTLFTQDWLAISLDATYDPALRATDLQLSAQAVPPAVLVFDGRLVCLAGADLAAAAPLATAVGRANHSLAVSPYVTGIAYMDELTVSATMAIDATLQSAAQPGVTTTRLHSTVDVGFIAITNVVEFTGMLESFSALTISLDIVEFGLSVFASLLPTGDGTDRLRVQIGSHWTFGNAVVLPAPPGTGSQCTGDTCY